MLKKKGINWDRLKKDSVLILGFGKEGQDTLSFLRKKFPKKVIGIADERRDLVIDDPRVRTHLGKSYLKSIPEYQIAIRTPGIPLFKIRPFLKKTRLTSQADIFLNLSKGKIVGVTGTKGKSATCNAIYNILKENIKEDVYLLGNIGTPSLNFLDKKGVFVYELSSFQLESITASPQIAVLLNIYRDHLDSHQSYEEYFDAKSNITAFQGISDHLIYNKKDSEVLKVLSRSKAKRIPFDPEEKIKDSVVYFDPILKVAQIFEIPEDRVKRKLRSFRPLPHRLEYLGEFKRIKFYNDSAATIPEATVSAIKNLEENLETLITGGKDKGVDYKNLGQVIKRSKIKNLITFPDTGEKIYKEVGKINHFPVKSMKEAVEIAFKKTSKGKICLFSPASSSFNMFENYKERGDIFKKTLKSG